MWREWGKGWKEGVTRIEGLVKKGVERVGRRCGKEEWVGGVGVTYCLISFLF